MADNRRYASSATQLDIGKILLEAQNRWLRPAEICEILQNYRKFRISPGPPNKPPSFFLNPRFQYQEGFESSNHIRSGVTKVIERLALDVTFVIEATREVAQFRGKIGRFGDLTTQTALGIMNPGGSLFLFDRKVLRYFRKDGHNWRKKKDGKTVKEAHERLKAGSVDVLHCYYAHGEENENFQRRSYWMLEEEFEHIVLVHYREVKGNKISFGRTTDAEETFQNTKICSPVHSASLYTDQSRVLSQTMDTTSMNSAQTSEYEDVESADNRQANSRYYPFLELQQSEDCPVTNQVDASLLSTTFQNTGEYGKRSTFPAMDFLSLDQGNLSKKNSNTGFQLNFHELSKQIETASWQDVFGECTMGLPTASFQSDFPSDRTVNMDGMPNKEFNFMLEQLFTDDINIKQESVTSPDTPAEWQIGSGEDSLDVSTRPIDHNLHAQLTYELKTSFEGHGGQRMAEPSFIELDKKNELQIQFKDNSLLGEVECLQTSTLDAVDGYSIKDNSNNPCSQKQSLLDYSKTEEGLKKFDSFSRWMSKELGEVEESIVPSSSVIYWNTDESGNMIEDSSMSHHVDLDADLLSPSLSQDQLFSILDFSPSWAYSGLETKVLVTGKFLKDQKHVQECKWSCMFGEVEVPAEVLAAGVLRCYAPPHTAGRVPFYITCSNRSACSEIREFEYRLSNIRYADVVDMCDGNTSEMLLRIRLGKLLSLTSDIHSKTSPSSSDEKPNISRKISSLLKENDDEWFQMINLTTDKELSRVKVKDQLLQKLLKEKLHSWLLLKVVEDGKGPNVLDKEGQGVIHLACAIGYDWAIAPIIAAGVNINFRDVNGWTALHWAAFCGRERTVAALVSMDGAAGALTDPTPEFPSGRTPADLASNNGHKGIAGYLAESSLTSHLSSLTLKETSRDGDALTVSGEGHREIISEQTGAKSNEGDVQDGLSMKDSLTAVRNAAQAAARIHEVYRVQSFHRKQLIEYGDHKFGISDEHALSLLSIQKTHKTGQHDGPTHTAAIRIQNKFRGWKGRKEFLIIRQRIVKIQAHVRGHQVRKHYKKIIWSVGIVDKVILRWRRKGAGLRGFRSEGLIEASAMDCGPSKEDDYDFLKEGRKQAEARMEKALARVKSMVQYPEARDQYRRLLEVVTEFQESKLASEEEELIEFEMEAEDQIFMPET